LREFVDAADAMDVYRVRADADLTTLVNLLEEAQVALPEQVFESLREAGMEVEGSVARITAVVSEATTLSAGAQTVVTEFRVKKRQPPAQDSAVRRRKETLEKGGSARPAEDADDFEQVCAEFMRSAGFSDAKKTPMGPDGGVDVVANGAVGQAKFHGSQKVTGESIRALHGSRDQLGRDRVAMFFAYGPGYTDDALKAARDLRVYCYKYNAREGRFDRIR
jgi:hypothetical protein